MRFAQRLNHKKTLKLKLFKIDSIGEKIGDKKEKIMKKTIHIRTFTAWVFLAGLASIAQAASVSDNFNRGTTGSQTSNSFPNLIGTNYMIESGEWSINANGNLAASGNPGIMVETSLPLGRNGFTLSVDVNARYTSQKFGGLLFNYQDATNGYALRFSVNVTTGSVQLLRLDTGADLLGPGGIPIENRQAAGMTANQFYTMTVSSSGGIINYSISDVGGGTTWISGSYTNSLFTDGYSGFYKRVGATDTVLFDNYSLNVSSPASLRLIVISSAPGM